MRITNEPWPTSPIPFATLELESGDQLRFIRDELSGKMRVHLYYRAAPDVLQWTSSCFALSRGDLGKLREMLGREFE